jgi:hypothetical protein
MGLSAEKMRRATCADLENGKWGEPVIHRDAEVVRAAPFEAIALELSVLWA